MANKDYSHRDVTDKLGLKPGHAVRLVGQGDPELLDKAVAKIGRALVAEKTTADVMLYWPASADEITPTLETLKTQMEQNGGIWVFTAKRNQTGANGMPYFKQEDLIPLGLAAGLVDNKTCSASERESAMRFVIRKADRK